MAEDLDVEAMLEAPYRKDVCINLNRTSLRLVIFKYLFHLYDHTFPAIRV